ncbi:MAG: hypothetical protein IKA82_00095 [Clostridia bacterium]|nr:hypothetical protein [Clostridia bacterium]
MRKHLSVLGLIGRCSIYRICATLALLAVAELALFWWRLSEALRWYEHDIGVADSFSRFEYLIDRSHISWCLVIAFVAVTVLLCLTGIETKSRISYTLDRLSVSPRAIFLMQFFYNIFAYLLLWATQLALLLVMGNVYNALIPEDLLNPQGAFMAFYLNDFLHSLLPLADIPLWGRNLFILVSLGAVSAHFPKMQRKKHRPIAPVALVLFITVFFTVPRSGVFNILIVSLFCLSLTVSAMRGALKKEVSYEN